MGVTILTRNWSSNILKWGMIGYKDGDDMYKNQEKKLMWLVFIVAAIMLLSIMGRIFGSH